jgi:hypothetical protein
LSEEQRFMSMTANSSAEYVIELLSEHGQRRATLGWSNADAAFEAYDATIRKYPHTRVRLRQGEQRKRSCIKHDPGA